MADTATRPPESFWQKDSFRFIKAEEFEKTYLDAAKERQKRMEEELQKGSGG